jgi:hypothetical protein
MDCGSDEYLASRYVELLAPVIPGHSLGIQVEWTEINAAWGQTLLLLYTIARKLDFSFEKCAILILA